MAGKTLEHTYSKWDQTFLAHCKIVAEQDKAWAIDREKIVGREWVGASQVSKGMLQDRLDKSVDELAQEKFEYRKMRATARGSYNYWLDTSAHNYYMKHSGMGKALKTAVKHYKVALLWAEEYDDMEIEDIPPHWEARDIEEFMHKAGHLLDNWDAEQLGHDFYLTRKGHGAGFWDRGHEHGDELTKICEAYGNLDITDFEENGEKQLEISVHSLNK